MELTVNLQSITAQGEKLVSGSVEQYTAHFTFSEEWDEYEKTAVFVGGNGTIYQMLLVNNSCVIPKECLDRAGHLSIGVFGVNEEKIRPTVWTAPLYVEQGAMEGENPTPPTPDIYAQILSALDDVTARVLNTYTKEETYSQSEANDLFTRPVQVAELVREILSHNRFTAWANPNTSVPFIGQTVSLDYPPYGTPQACEITWMNVNGTGQTFTQTVYTDHPKMCAEYTFYYNGAIYACCREANVRFNERQIVFSGCSQNGGSADDKLIPVRARWIYF